MKTKILSIVLVFAIALFLLGCGTKTTEKQTTEQQTTTQTSDESAAVAVSSEESESNVNVVDYEDVEVETVEVEIIAETEEVEEETTAEESTPKTVEVKIDSYAFEEKTLSIKVGTTVVWENYDSVPHTVTGDGLDSGKLSKGDIYEYTFTEPGTYEYYCEYHPSMTAKVIVE